MRRPAVSRFGGVAVVVVMACWTGKGEQSTPVVTDLEPGPRDLTGGYWCSIDDAGYEFPRYPCVIKKVGKRLMLAKLAGSQRIRGHIKLDKREGFTFTGELYCPWGDCTERMRGRFAPAGRGGFKGTLNGPLDHRELEASMIVRLIPAPANAFGGVAYGGDGYGDPFGYGGDGYGGASYGYNRIDRRLRGGP